MTSVKAKSFVIIIAILMALVLVSGCGQPTPPQPFEGTLAIYHAGSLAVP